MISLADLSGKRANRARGAVTTAERAQIEHSHQSPKRDVPPELDVRVFDARAGLKDEDQNDQVLRQARRAYAAHGERLQLWHKREAVIHANQFELPAKKRVLVSKMVQGELGQVTALAMDARKDVMDAIAEIDKGMDRAFRNRLKTDEAREIRQHCKTMSKSERAKFLHSADDDVVASVLAAKPFLSGLSDAEANKFRYDAVRRFFPAEVARRGKLERAQELLEAVDKQFISFANAMIDPHLQDFEEQQAAMKKAVAGAE